MAAKRSASSHVGVTTRLRAWLWHHLACQGESLLRLIRSPVASLLTMAVLAIALALPGGLFLVTNNLLALSGGWDASAQITLYLQEDADNDRASGLAAELKRDQRFSEVIFMSREQALEEFRQLADFGDALGVLDENPLPAVITLRPAAGQVTPDNARAIVDELQQLSLVDQAQLDLQWVHRLHAIVKIIQNGLLVVFAMLALAVILIVGNTIRLEIENRRDEIVITHMFGATKAFIRRPFLYDGLWFGLFGGLLASGLILAALWLLSGPAAELVALYDSGFRIIYPDTVFILGLIASGGLLGYLGAWTAVSQHLIGAEPS